jgi:hypothetical protein
MLFYSFTRKLETKKLRQILRKLIELFEPLEEQDALDDLQEFLERIKTTDRSEDKEQEREIALDLTEWLSSFISFVISTHISLSCTQSFDSHRARLVNLEDCTLWDLWYTGGRVVPSEVRLRISHT